MKKCLLVVVCCAAFIANGFAQQSKKDEAKALGQKALVLMDDERKYNQAIKLLEQAQQLDPEEINYPYEIAYAHNALANYKKAAAMLEKLANRPDAFARVYQFLGNNYALMKQPEKAIATYENGLKRFPDAGELYMELGSVVVGKGNYPKALQYFERGIKVNPAYAGNYYWAAKIYCNSTEEVWGMLYGELFMNLERSGSRWEEIGKLLFKTYKSEIVFTDKNNLSISFSKTSEVEAGSGKLPFPLVVYEPLLGIAVVGLSDISLPSLHTIRENFLKTYFEKELNLTYPNVLFDYQKRIADAGHLEAYNYWLLGMGDDVTFNRWKAMNDTKWNAFNSWIGANRLYLDTDNCFHRDQY